MPKYHFNGNHVDQVDESHEFEPVLIVSSAPFAALEERTLVLVAAALRAELIDTQAIRDEVLALESVQNSHRAQKRRKIQEKITQRVGHNLYQGHDVVISRGVLGYGPRKDYFEKARKNDAVSVGINVDITMADAQERAREWARQGLFADRSSHKRHGLPAVVAEDFDHLTFIEREDVNHLIVVDGLLSGQEAARYILDDLAQVQILPNVDAL